MCWIMNYDLEGNVWKQSYAQDSVIWMVWSTWKVEVLTFMYLCMKLCFTSMVKIQWLRCEICIYERLVSFTNRIDYVFFVLDDYMMILRWKVVITMLNLWAMYELGLMMGNVLLQIWNYKFTFTMYKLENNA